MVPAVHKSVEERVRGLTDAQVPGLLGQSGFLRFDPDPEAKREAGATVRGRFKAGAAPATVNGELLSLYATGAKHREGETAATTRKPGDLP